MIIGITGTNGAGKGTVVDYLVEKKNFSHFSVRDFLITELKKRNLEINRDNFIVIANEIREKNNPSYIIDQLFEKANQIDKNCIIESIRNPGEVLSLRAKSNFILLAVDAEQKIRYDRIKQRKSETDNISFEEFKKQEEIEFNSNDINKQNISKCIQMADYIIKNDTNIDELNKKIEEVLNGITK